jgi:hypothetical protein
MMDIYLPIEIANIVTTYIQEYSWLKEFIEKQTTNDIWAPRYHYKKIGLCNYLRWSRETFIIYKLHEPWIRNTLLLKRQVIYIKLDKRHH